MKAILGATLALALVEPAQASCHKFSYWAFPWPQRCPAIRVASVAKPAPAEPTVLLPSLTAIEWGQAIDDERERAMIALKIKLRGE